MLSKIYSSGIFGIEGFEVAVECSAWDRLPKFDLVGLPDTAVKEAKGRVRSACENSGFFLLVIAVINQAVPLKYLRHHSKQALLCHIYL